MELTVWDSVYGYVTEVAFCCARMKLHLGISVEVFEELGLARAAQEVFIAVDTSSRSIKLDHRCCLSDADRLSVKSTEHVAVQSFGAYYDQDVYYKCGY